MKKVLLLFAAVLMSVACFAKDKDKNPNDYPLSAHVVALTAFGDGQSRQSMSSVQFLIGNNLYVAGQECVSRVSVGTDVRVKFETNKGSKIGGALLYGPYAGQHRASETGQKLRVLTGDGQTCTTHILGVQEVK